MWLPLSDPLPPCRVWSWSQIQWFFCFFYAFPFELSQLDNLILCHNLSFVTIRVLSQFEFLSCQNLSFWILWQIEFLSFVTRDRLHHDTMDFFLAAAAAAIYQKKVIWKETLDITVMPGGVLSPGEEARVGTSQMLSRVGANNLMIGVLGQGGQQLWLVMM